MHTFKPFIIAWLHLVELQDALFLIYKILHLFIDCYKEKNNSNHTITLTSKLSTSLNLLLHKYIKISHDLHSTSVIFTACSEMWFKGQIHSLLINRPESEMLWILAQSFFFIKKIKFFLMRFITAMNVCKMKWMVVGIKNEF